MQSFTGCSIGEAAALPAASLPPGAALPVAAAPPPHAAAPAAAAPLASAATTVTDPASGASLRPIATDVESEVAAARGPSACSSVASSSSSSASSSVASSSSSSFSRESLFRAFSAWSTTATALPDPVHLPPLLPVPGAAVSAGGGSENFYSGAASQVPESPSPSPATAAAVSAAFFGAPEAAASPGGSASAACTGGGAAAGAASFSSSAAVAAANSPSSPFSGGSSPWFPLRAPRLSAAAAAAAASKRRCVRLQPGASPFPTAPPGGAPEAAADCVEVTALGAGSEVGRSCVLLQHRGYCVMFDCGVHPAHAGIGALPIFDAFDMRKVSVCLITHFHLDHCGALPYLLCKTSFRGRVFMTAPTKVISRLLWLDYARMAAFDDDRSSGGAAAAGTGGGGGRGAAGGAGAGGGGGAGAAAAGRSAAIYSEQDVEAALRMIETIDFHQEVEVQGIKISCYGAGHVLGACMFLVETGGVRTLYTGDFSSEEDRHVPAAELPAVDVQLLLCESTYGVQVHEPRQQREGRLIAAILEIVLQRRGKVLLPVFALGRVQELLLILEEYWRSHPAVQHVPILFISPLASKSIAVFDAFLHMSGRQLRQQALQGENPFAFQFVKSLKSYDGAAARLYVHRDAPAVIFAAPGMLQSGASRRIFEVLAPHARNGVILTGYSVKGTLAEELKREPEHLLLPRSDAGGGGGAGAAAAGGAAAETDLQPQQQVLRRRCSCQVISFSAHSDYLQTSAFIKQLRVPNVVLVHGERNEMRRLRDKLQEETPDLAVFTPEILQTVSLQFCSSSSSGSSSSNAAATPAPVCAVAAGKLADEIFRGCGGGADAAGRARTQNSRSKASETASSSGTESEEEEEVDGEDDLLLDVEGVVVLEEGEHPLLVHAEELSVAARIPVMRMQQKLRLAFPYPLCLLRKAAALVFEDCISFAAAAAAAPPSHTSGTSAAAGTAAAALKSAAAAVDQSQRTEEEEEQGRSHAGSRKTLLCNGNSSGSSETRNADSRSGAPSSAASRSSSDSSTTGQGSATTARRCSMTSSVEMVRGDGGTSSSSAGTGSSALPGDAWHIGDEGNSDVGFCVGDCVSVYRHPRFAEEVVIEWLASPTADMVADALSFLLLDILRVNSSGNGCKQMQHLMCDREQQSDAVLVDVLQAQLSHIFGAVQVLPRSVHTAARAVAKAAALEAAPAAAPAEAAQVAAAGAKVGSAKAGPGGAVAANAGQDADTRAAEDAAGGRVDAAAEKTKGNFDSDEEPRQHHQQAQQQQRQQGEDEEEEERRMRAAVERAELEQGEVVLRFWARRLTAAAAAGGLSSADGSSSAAQEPQAEEHPAAAAGAGKKPAFVLVPVEIDLAQRTVHCEDSEVRQRVQAFVRRVETSLLPLPVFS